MTALGIRAPRLNANDDAVVVSRVLVKQGDVVRKDAVLAEVESDKSTFEVQAPEDGFVLRVAASEGTSIAAGSIILWIGAQACTELPEAEELTGLAPGPRVTAKARALLTQHKIPESAFDGHEGTITAALVQDLVDHLGKDAEATGFLPAAGSSAPLSPPAKAMAKTVKWHAREPVPAYVEVPFDHAGWEEFARRFAQAHDLFADPALSLLAYELVKCAKTQPELNATLFEHNRFLYSQINVGFAIQAKSGLVMAVLRNAERLNRIEFVQALQALQKRAIGGKLTPEQTAGITLGLSSLASANVTRHIPVLPPHTCLIVAHSAKPPSGAGVIGATYDHRLLDGETVARVLGKLSQPPFIRRKP